ncbi:iron hydrogenase [Tritrichomonas foetus]|uniref:Iron hydrogenase n=1 Tax=Tritrichomonas foetus TaxID=1144522 RepID=A0A1J4KU50_9EUKA|nr:iron hydrogenase [Tritrichomonas foetus]|eukprot:OHT14791.1 iron hydrogenase [Tritrichomonas foetus]
MKIITSLHTICLMLSQTLSRRSAAAAVASPSPDFSTNSIVLDRSKCVACGMCIKACNSVAGQGVLKLVKVGNKKLVSTKSGKPLQETNCIKCGQCTLVCGPGALTQKDAIQTVSEVLKNPGDKVLVCQTAPAIRVNLADGLGMPAGSIITGKMVTALKMLGFKYVFDTNFGADLTIVEEATELVNRIKDSKNGPLPMFTSCCPAWVNYVEQSQPDIIPNLSTCRSPVGMLSNVLKGEFPKLLNVDETKIYNVAIMPCTAKKDEAERPQLRTEKGTKETDAVITTRELVKMIKDAKIDFKNLPDTPFDKLYSEASGGGAIFCNTGGVMEAAIRSAYRFYTGKELKDYNILDVRGLDGIKLASVDFDGTPIKFSVAQGVANAMKLIKKIKNHEDDVKDVKFVEVMACPGGCVCGGGSTRAKTKKVMEKRIEAAYKIDENSKSRVSHINTELNECYDRYLDGKYFSHKAHHNFHTHLTPREIH